MPADEQIEHSVARGVEAIPEMRLDVEAVLASAKVELLRVLSERARRRRRRREDDLHRAAAEVDDADGLLRRCGRLGLVEGVEQVVDRHPAEEALLAPVEQARPRAAEEEARRRQLGAH
jgi:hypothetical protein